MIDLVATSAAGQPKRWLVAFRRTSKSKWVRLLACGTYQHVMAMGYVAEVDHWVFYEVRFRQTDIIVARGRHANALMAHYAQDADLLGIPSLQGGRSPFHFGFSCVSAVKHLIGLRSGALRPDTLFRHLILHGAEILSDDTRPATDDDPARPYAATAAGAGQAG